MCLGTFSHKARLLQHNHLPTAECASSRSVLSYGNEVSYTMKTPITNRLCTGTASNNNCAVRQAAMVCMPVLSIGEYRMRCADAGFRYCRRSQRFSFAFKSRSSCLPERGSSFSLRLQRSLHICFCGYNDLIALYALGKLRIFVTEILRIKSLPYPRITTLPCHLDQLVYIMGKISASGNSTLSSHVLVRAGTVKLLLAAFQNSCTGIPRCPANSLRSDPAWFRLQRLSGWTSRIQKCSRFMLPRAPHALLLHRKSSAVRRTVLHSNAVPLASQ